MSFSYTVDRSRNAGRGEWCRPRLFAETLPADLGYA
jgi:hypothetical protein